MDSACTIVMVDDDRDILALSAELLESEGFTVQIFNNPIKACEYIKNNLSATGLLFTDQRMPLMSGVQLYTKVREYSSTLPVMICSGDENVPELLSSKNDSKLFFMRKPYAPVGLLERVKQVIAS